MTYQPYTDGSYRIAVGWLNRVQLDSTYEITRLPKQSDQGRAPWRIPLNNSSVYEQWGEVSRSLGGSAGGYGNGNFTWELGGLTPGMMDYVQHTLFSGKAAEQFTIMTWDRQGRWQTVWAWGYYERMADAGEPGWRKGYALLRIPFVVEQDAPTGPDVVMTIAAPEMTVNTQADIIATASNQGDGATYDDIVYTVDLPTEMTFVSAAVATGTLTYYESGAWVSSVGTPADVTRVRVILSDVLNAGASADSLTITVMPNSDGTVNVTGSISTIGDTDTGNDTASDSSVISPEV